MTLPKGTKLKGYVLLRFVDKRHMIVALSRAPVNLYHEEGETTISVPPT